MFLLSTAGHRALAGRESLGRAAGVRGEVGVAAPVGKPVRRELYGARWKAWAQDAGWRSCWLLRTAVLPPRGKSQEAGDGGVGECGVEAGCCACVVRLAAVAPVRADGRGGVDGVDGWSKWTRPLGLHLVTWAALNVLLSLG